jgi:hypothetical protein
MPNVGIAIRSAESGNLTCTSAIGYSKENPLVGCVGQRDVRVLVDGQLDLRRGVRFE